MSFITPERGSRASMGMGSAEIPTDEIPRAISNQAATPNAQEIFLFMASSLLPGKSVYTPFIRFPKGEKRDLVRDP
jgi:hypothetical protein